jgi:ribosomal protein L37E
MATTRPFEPFPQFTLNTETVTPVFRCPACCAGQLNTSCEEKTLLDKEVVKGEAAQWVVRDRKGGRVQYVVLKLTCSSCEFTMMSRLLKEESMSPEHLYVQIMENLLTLMVGGKFQFSGPPAITVRTQKALNELDYMATVPRAGAGKVVI